MKQEVTSKKVFLRTFGWPMACVYPEQASRRRVRRRAIGGDYACPPTKSSEALPAIRLLNGRRRKPVRAITSLLKGEGGEKIAEAILRLLINQEVMRSKR